VSIFGNLGELLDFQRRFLIAMEATLALPFEEQRIGALFVSNVSFYAIEGEGRCIFSVCSNMWEL
jgi:cell division control protein 24